MPSGASIPEPVPRRKAEYLACDGTGTRIRAQSRDQFTQTTTVHHRVVIQYPEQFSPLGHQPTNATITARRKSDIPDTSDDLNTRK
jgi:hypothetical protein